MDEAKARGFSDATTRATVEHRTDRPRLAPAGAAQQLASLSPARPPAPAEEVARRAARPTVPEPIRRARPARGRAPSAPIARAPVRHRLDPQRTGPLPLPPPPPVAEPEPWPVLVAIAATARANAAAAASAATSERARDTPRAAAKPRRAGRRLAPRIATILIAPLLAAAALVLYTQRARPAATSTTALPPVAGAELDEPSYARARVEPAPAAAAAQAADAPKLPRPPSHTHRGAR